MKIYISGKITGLDEEVFKAKFQSDEDLLTELGYDTVNPTKLTGQNDETWQECMVDCVRALFDCQAIYLQPDWNQSRGARVEYQIAREMGMVVMYGSMMNY